MEGLRYKYYYPMLGLALSILILAILLTLVSVTTKRLFASFATGFTLSFILSSMDEVYVLKYVFRPKHGSDQSFDAKGALKKGKAINTLITSVLGFIVALMSLTG